MRRFFLTFLGVVAATTVAWAAERPVIEPVALTDADAIQWTGKKQAAIEAKRITADASILLRRCRDITITACELRSIELVDCDGVTIRNCWIHDSARSGVRVLNSRRVRVEGCRIEQVASGVWVVRSRQVEVVGNFVRNVQGPFPRGQLAQFDKVTGADSAIRGNYGINERGRSTPEDMISLFMSRGTEKSPILIEDNYLTGDPVEGSEDKSGSGSGIMLGDAGGAHLLCRRNVVISAGQVGIGVAGGRFIRVEGNLIFGARSNVSNVGLYVWNQSKEPSDHVTVARNRVHWLNRNGGENSWWRGGETPALELSDNRFADVSLAAELPGPPSDAPLPPRPWLGPGANGTSVARLPWTPE